MELGAEKWVKLHTKLKYTSWYKKSYVKAVFIDLLLDAYHPDFKILVEGEEILITAGMIVTGRKKLAENTGLTEQNIRTALTTLKSTNVITNRTFKNLTIVTLNNWSEYQSTNQETNQQVTNSQPTGNQHLTTRNKNIEERRENNIHTHTNTGACARENQEAFTESDDNEAPYFLKKYTEAFTQIFRKWNVNRKGNYDSEWAEFLKHVDTQSETEHHEIKLAAFGYLGSPDVAKGITKNLSTWLPEWKNWKDEVKSNTKKPKQKSGCPKCNFSGYIEARDENGNFTSRIIQCDCVGKDNVYEIHSVREDGQRASGSHKTPPVGRELSY